MSSNSKRMIQKKKKSLEPWIGACLRTDSQGFTNDEAMDWSEPPAVFLFFFLTSIQKKWDTSRYAYPSVSPRIPVRVQYPALIRHLCAVSLQRRWRDNLRHTWLPTSNIFRHLILVLGHGSFRSISWKNNKLLLPACVPYVDRSMPVEEHV